LTECAGEVGGHAGFWQAVEWVYAQTRSDGQGIPNGLRYPGASLSMEQCLASERPDAAIRQQVEQATQQGVAATPSVRFHDRKTDQILMLQGPIDGDALLSAMDMLAVEPSNENPTTEMPADAFGDIPGSPRS